MRVISMVPSWTETFIECGIEVVGRTRFCIHPSPQVKAIPAVGGTKDINWEKVSALKADLLVLDQEENPRFMAEQSPLPFMATHIRSVPDVARDLATLAKTFSNSALADLAQRWSRLSEAAPTGALNVQDLPGVLEWIKPPIATADSFIYLIWHKPWMAVSRQTFIGSVIKTLGFGKWMVDFPSPYPEIVLENFDPEKTILLASTEPFPFLRKRTVLQELPFSSAIVDGESFSWFGLRSLKFLEKNSGR